MFSGVLGQHQHDEGSPSYYNVSEGEEVVRVLQSLVNKDWSIPRYWTLSTGGSRDRERRRVTTKHVGVICAFRAQVLLMRRYLREHGLGAVNVGSVEDFQGQEMTICVVSTVLSSRQKGASSSSSSFSSSSSQAQAQAQGLLGDPNKFNVAITRARALCLVVGHPTCLAHDPYWHAYMIACFEKDGCRYVCSYLFLHLLIFFLLCPALSLLSCFAAVSISSFYPLPPSLSLATIHILTSLFLSLLLFFSLFYPLTTYN